MSMLFRMATWMSRRNGKALAKGAVRWFSTRKTDPNELEEWEAFLAHRPAWKPLRKGVFEFQYGGRVQLSTQQTAAERLALIARIELKRLAVDMEEDVANALAEAGMDAAVTAWQATYA